MKRLLLFLFTAPAFAVEPMSSTDLDKQVISPPAGAISASNAATTKSSSNPDTKDTSQKADERFAEVMSEASKILSERAGLEYDLSVSGVHYGSSSENRVYENGSFSMAVPERIDQVSMENIRVRESDTPPMGNVFMQNIEINNSEMIVTPR